LVESRELAAHNLGDDGTVPGAELTTATFARRALALELGDLHLSLARCMVVESDTVTDGGVTEGGVSGERRFTGNDAAGIRGAGNEINIEFDGGCSSETAANLDEVELPSEERLLLFEDMTWE